MKHIRTAAAALVLALFLPAFAHAGACAPNQQLRMLSSVAPRPSPTPATYVDFGQAGCTAAGALDTNLLAPFATHVRVRALSFPRTGTNPPISAAYRFDAGDYRPLNFDWNASMQSWDATLDIAGVNRSVTATATLWNLQGVPQTFTVTYHRAESP